MREKDRVEFDLLRDEYRDYYISERKGMIGEMSGVRTWLYDKAAISLLPIAVVAGAYFGYTSGADFIHYLAELECGSFEGPAGHIRFAGGILGAGFGLISDVIFYTSLDKTLGPNESKILDKLRERKLRDTD